MSDTLVRKNCGAVEFVKPPNAASSVSQAVMFSSVSDNCVDSAWDDILEALRRFYTLLDDWDGNDSVAPESEVIDNAIYLAEELKHSEHPAPDRVVAGVNGTVSFESGPVPMRELEVVSGSIAELYEDGTLIQVIETRT